MWIQATTPKGDTLFIGVDYCMMTMLFLETNYVGHLFDSLLVPALDTCKSSSTLSDNRGRTRLRVCYYGLTVMATGYLIFGRVCSDNHAENLSQPNE